MKKNLFPVAFLGLAFSGCGDDVTKTTGVAQLAAGETFPECASENVGEMLFAADSGAVYYCADGKWQTLKGESGEDGESCEVELLSDSTGYKVLCGRDSVGVILNGAKGDAGKEGAKGENGKPGENGENCEVELLEDNSGYKILCGGDSVGVVLNGAKGDSGAPGANAENCTLSDNGNGTDGHGQALQGGVRNGTLRPGEKFLPARATLRHKRKFFCDNGIFESNDA